MPGRPWACAPARAVRPAPLPHSALSLFGRSPGDKGDKSTLAEPDLKRAKLHQVARLPSFRRVARSSWPSIFLPLHLQYKARVHLLARYLKGCKRELKLALSVQSQDAPALYVKSCYEYVRKNFRKSIRLLNSCPKDAVRPWRLPRRRPIARPARANDRLLIFYSPQSFLPRPSRTSLWARTRAFCSSTTWAASTSRLVSKLRGEPCRVSLPLLSHPNRAPLIHLLPPPPPSRHRWARPTWRRCILQRPWR